MRNKYIKDKKVKILYGKNKGQISTIKSYIKKIKKIVVYNVNLFKKHIKPNKKNKGCEKLKEMPIDISNVKIL